MAETDETFEQRVKDIVINGFLTSGLAIGHQLKLFDALAEFDDFETVGNIASKSNCKPRYLEEWLKMMTVAHIIEIDETEQKFFLPKHRRAALVSTTNPVGFALNATPSLTYNHDSIIDCFKTSGPSYASPSSKIFEVLDAGGEADWGSYWNHVIVPRFPSVDQKLKIGGRLCDVGCAGGALLHFLSRHYPNSTFTGLDLRPEYIAKAKAGVTDQTNVDFVVGDITNLGSMVDKEQFDYMHASLLLHDLDRPDLGAKQMLQMLKPGGQALFVEFDFSNSVRENAKLPAATIFYGFSIYYCLSSAFTSPNCPPLGTLAGRSTLHDVLTHAGFTSVTLHGFEDFTRTLIIDAHK